MAARSLSQNDISVEIRDPQRNEQTTADITYLAYFEPSCDDNAFLPQIQAGLIFHKLLKLLPVSSPSCKLSGTAVCLSWAPAIRLKQLQVYSYTVYPVVEASCNTPDGQRMEPVVNNTTALLLSGSRQSFVGNSMK